MSQLPVYTCHKKVRADKIVDVELNGDLSVTITTQLGFQIKLTGGPLLNKQPASLVGGYYVVYDDGYESWSPAKAFEEGYTMDEGEPQLDESLDLLKIPPVR
jgi:hypothetical protein